LRQIPYQISKWASSTLVGLKQLPASEVTGTGKDDVTSTPRPMLGLDRLQTEEWRGWMQLVLVAYHYWRGHFLYNWIRVFVSSYVWLSGFGNHLYYSDVDYDNHRKRAPDFSWRRTTQILLRVNLLPKLLSIMCAVPPSLFYMCELQFSTFVCCYIVGYCYYRTKSLGPFGAAVCKHTAIWALVVLHVLFFEIYERNLENAFEVMGQGGRAVPGSRESDWNSWFTRLFHSVSLSFFAEVREFLFRFRLSKYDGLYGILFAEYVFMPIRNLITNERRKKIMKIENLKASSAQPKSNAVPQESSNDLEETVFTRKTKDRFSSKETVSTIASPGDMDDDSPTGAHTRERRKASNVEDERPVAVDAQASKTSSVALDSGARNTDKSPEAKVVILSSATVFTGLSLLSFAVILIGIWHHYYGGLADKFSYNEHHPYVSWMPIVALVLLRNAPEALLDKPIYSPFLAWFGSLSLELYVLQCHILMCGNVEKILVLVPGGWDAVDRVGRRTQPVQGGLPYMFNTVLCWVLYVAAADFAKRLVARLCKHVDYQFWGKKEEAYKLSKASKQE